MRTAFVSAAALLLCGVATASAATAMHPSDTVILSAAQRRAVWNDLLAFPPCLAMTRFKDGDYLPNDFILSANYGFGCAAGNKSPHLQWSHAPADTKSFAVTCYDPDAPTGSGFWHWAYMNEGLSSHELPTKAITHPSFFAELRCPVLAMADFPLGSPRGRE
jgi:hypothetical protein